MAKDKITEYDATAANNTVVGDVNLAENSALPSDMNNAVREVMSHQKEAFGSGTPLLVDQTNNRVGIGLAAPEQLLHLRNASGNCVAVLGQFGTGTKATITAAANQVEIKADSGTNDVMTFKTGPSERVRIDASGDIGIGTSSITNTSGYRNIHIDSPTSGMIMRMYANGTHVGQIQSASDQLQLNAITSIPIIFKTNNTERMRILAGGGLTFNGDTAAANALDDYEEGTFTPVISPGSGSFTTTSGAGYYTKIGNQVFVFGYMKIDNIGTGSGSLGFAGLPFASSNRSIPAGNRGGLLFIREDQRTGDTQHGFISAGQPYGSIQTQDGTNFSFATNDTFVFDGVYHTG